MACCGVATKIVNINGAEGTPNFTVVCTALMGTLLKKAMVQGNQTSEMW